MRIDEKGLLVLLISSLGIGGCGSSSGALDCDWLRTDSCWKRMVEEIRQCVAAEGSRGTLAGDAKTCTYDDGLEVRLDAPRSTNHFALFRDGSQCLRYDDDGATGEAKLRLTTAGGTLATDGTTSAFTLTCPDGSSFFTDSPMALYSCGQGALMPPGVVTRSSQGTNLGLNLTQDEMVSLVDCQ